MDIHQGPKVFKGHFGKAFIADIARIIDQDINRAKGIQGCLDNILPALFRCHGIIIGNRLTPGGLNFSNNAIRRSV